MNRRKINERSKIQYKYCYLRMNVQVGLKCFQITYRKEKFAGSAVVENGGFRLLWLSFESLK